MMIIQIKEMNEMDLNQLIIDLSSMRDVLTSVQKDPTLKEWHEMCDRIEQELMEFQINMEIKKDMM